MIKIKYIAGLDISYSAIDKAKAVVAVTVYDYDAFLNIGNRKTIKSVYASSLEVTITVEYSHENFIAREMPSYKLILAKLKKEKPQFYPSLLLLDCHGAIITENLPYHLGFLLNIPTIGIAKTFGNSNDITKSMLREQLVKSCNKKGDYMKIIDSNKQVLGVALKTTDNKSFAYAYVSVGYKIKLEQATEIVKKTCLHRVVEPIRVADSMSRSKLANSYTKLHGHLNINNKMKQESKLFNRLSGKNKHLIKQFYETQLAYDNLMQLYT